MLLKKCVNIFCFDLHLFLQDEDGVAVTPWIPEAIVKQWSHKDELRKFHDEMVDIYGAVDPATPSPPNKRVAAPSVDSQSNKRGRVVGPESICKMEDLKGEEQHKVGVLPYS